MNKPVAFVCGLVAGGVTCFALLLAIVHFRKRHAETPKVFAAATLERVPFDGEWLVFWGGETKRENAHVGVPPQDRALDLVQLQPGSRQTFSGDRLKNESYACWARPIVSPVSGVVAVAVDGIPDNVPGQMNPHMLSGNCLMIRSDAGFVVVLCHFKNGSVARKVGDRVRPGDFLGLCGNSGNASEPHLHLHVQSEVGFGRGQALRPVFAALSVNGTLRANYSPHKNDLIATGASAAPPPRR